MNTFFDLRLFSFPSRASESVQLNIVIVNSVAGNRFDVFDRHKQFVAVGINNLQAIVRRTAGRNVFQPHKTPDAVLDMNNRFADVECGNVRDKILGSYLFDGAAVLSGPQNILFGNHAQAVTAKPVRQVKHNHRHLADISLVNRFFPTVGKGKLQRGKTALGFGVVDQSKQPFARSRRITADNPLHFSVFGQIGKQIQINLSSVNAFGGGEIASR